MAVKGQDQRSAKSLLRLKVNAYLHLRLLKVKCTDNELYRVKPVFTFIEPKSVVIFDVNRHDGIGTVDQILFFTTLAKKTDDDPRILFAHSNSTTNNDDIIKTVSLTTVA
ncbi:hypothetical protein LOAG_10675 [Loa loa]|uniref:MSP domain-containing protein n=1 Tax=Loa loa TaxID=7209 RepID=A0A1S0TPF4_LOALO|nr:hypothetical protein LOAG_10675 [Loa loa]EFO17820.1 hypothetical protein LOAG_10675 [Loa loa]